MNGPLAGVDHEVAGWFHAHLSQQAGQLMLAMSEAGSAGWIAIMLCLSIAYLAWKRRWHGLLSVVLMVPGGMLLNAAIKILVHRHRPFATGQFALWDGYSFPSGHTIGATLLYGMLLLALVPLIQRRRWKLLAGLGTGLLILLVGFSRIALGAHYLTDVIGAIVLGLSWLTVSKLSLGLFRQYRHRRRESIGQVCRMEPETDDLNVRLAA